MLVDDPLPTVASSWFQRQVLGWNGHTESLPFTYEAVFGKQSLVRSSAHGGYGQ
jgi:hypothetical protein